MTIRWFPEMDEALRELRSKGYGYEATAARIGVSGKVVRKRIRELGMPVWSKAEGVRQRGPRGPQRNPRARA
jgi:aspartate aminotransferase-like enzyme